MNNTENLKLIYVNEIGVNSDDDYEYEFYFTETPDIVWAEDWAEQVPSACGDIPPSTDTYSIVKRTTSPFKIDTAQNNCCFSMQDCIDQILALCWWCDDNDDYYNIHFGTPYTIVEKLLNEFKLTLSDYGHKES